MHCVYRKLAALSTGNHHWGSRTIKSSLGRVKIVYSILFFTSSGCKDFVLLPSFTLLGEWSHLFSMPKNRCNFQLILFYTRRWTNRYSHVHNNNHLVPICDLFANTLKTCDLCSVLKKNTLDIEIGNFFGDARQWRCSIPGCFAPTGWWCQPSMEGGIEGRATTTICAFGGWEKGRFVWRWAIFTFEQWK